MDAKNTRLFKTHFKVIKIVDGDGLVVSNLFNKEEFEIRLLGIDAPEFSRCKKLSQDERELHIAGELLMKLGRISHKFLSKAAPRETIVSLVLEGKEFDFYGRTLAYVYLPDGRCLNEMMIHEGYARPLSRFYCQQLPLYQKLFTEARINKKGLFSIIPNW